MFPQMLFTMYPRPCRGGAGVGSVFFSTHKQTSISFYFFT